MSLIRSPKPLPAPAADVEWFAAVGDAPNGPLKLAALLELLRTGNITAESLVWREGFADWVALGVVAELSVVLGSVAELKAEVLPGPELEILVAEGSAHTSEPLRLPEELGAAVSGHSSPVSPPPDRQLSQSSGGVDFGRAFPSTTVQERSGRDGSSPAQRLGTDVVTDYGAPEESAHGAKRGISRFGLGLDLSGYQPADRCNESAVVEDLGELQLLGIRGGKRRSGALGPWIAVGAATLFGLTIGYVVFSNDPSPASADLPQRVANADADTPAPPDSSAATDAAESPLERVGSGPVVQAEATVVAVRGGDARSSDGSDAPAGDASGSPRPKSGGIAGLHGLTGARTLGPTGSEALSSGKGAAGTVLEASEIQLAVGRYKSSVKRGCWEPATSTRLPSAPSTARVELTVDIAPSGRVSSVASNGDPRGYRGLARCIEGRVRGWQFPASSSATTTRIPFVFATQ